MNEGLTDRRKNDGPILLRQSCKVKDLGSDHHQSLAKQGFATSRACNTKTAEHMHADSTASPPKTSAQQQVV